MDGLLIAGSVVTLVLFLRRGDRRLLPLAFGLVVMAGWARG